MGKLVNKLKKLNKYVEENKWTVAFIAFILLFCYKYYYLPKLKMNVIYPIRNRESDLEKTLPNIKRVLSENNIDYKIYVVEQSQDHQFNKGKLLNIGFLEAEKDKWGDYYYFSDVDISPKHKDTFDLTPIQGIVKHHYTGKDSILGGIFSTDQQTYKKMNGFSNNYWGWGWEDDDAMHRLENLRIPVDQSKVLYRANDQDKVTDILTPEEDKPYNNKNPNLKLFEQNKVNYKSDPKSIRKDGLTNCKYSVLDRYDYGNDPNCKRIVVDIEPGCKTNIIFPIRDREEDLERTLPNIKRVFEENGLEYKIYVIEQVPGKEFNKGKLLNVGFLEAEKDGWGNYYYFSDVDIYPKYKDTFDLSCVPGIVKHHYTELDDTLGGIFSTDGKTYKKINGFHNDFWGWGGEDDDIINRFNAIGVNVDQSKTLHRYVDGNQVVDVLTPEDGKPRNQVTPNTKLLDSNKILYHNKKKEGVMKNGLNNCEYNIVNVSGDDIKRILVDI